jgi:hypothetical protein
MYDYVLSLCHSSVLLCHDPSTDGGNGFLLAPPQAKLGERLKILRDYLGTILPLV